MSEISSHHSIELSERQKYAASAICGVVIAMPAAHIVETTLLPEQAMRPSLEQHTKEHAATVESGQSNLHDLQMQHDAFTSISVIAGDGLALVST